MSIESELKKLSKEQLISMYIETNHFLDLMAGHSRGTEQLVSSVQECAEDGCEICLMTTGLDPSTICEDGRAKDCTGVRTVVAFETPPDKDPIHVCGMCAEAYY